MVSGNNYIRRDICKYRVHGNDIKHEIGFFSLSKIACFRFHLNNNKKLLSQTKYSRSIFFSSSLSFIFYSTKTSFLFLDINLNRILFIIGVFPACIIQTFTWTKFFTLFSFGLFYLHLHVKSNEKKNNNKKLKSHIVNIN